MKQRWKRVSAITVALLLLVLMGWQLTTPKVKRTRVFSDILTAAVSPDGDHIAWVSTSDNTTTYVRNTVTGQDTKLAGGLSREYAWSADGRYLLLSTWDSRTIHDMQEGSQVKTEIPTASEVKWASKGPWFAAGGTRQPFQLRRADSPDDAVPLFPAGVDLLAINGDGPSIALNRTTDDLYVTERPGSAPIVAMTQTRRVAASPDGLCWATFPSETSYTLHCNAQSYTHAYEPVGSGRYFFTAGSWSPDHQWFAVIGSTAEGGEDLRVFAADGTQRVFMPKAFDKTPVYASMWWSPDGEWFGVVTRDIPALLVHVNQFHVFELRSGKRRTWSDTMLGSSSSDHFTWIDERTVYAQAGDALYRFDLR